MDNERTTALTKKLAGNSGKDARQIFHNAIASQGETKTESLTLLHQNPGAALALLEHPIGLGLTNRGAADVLDAVVGEIYDQDKARELLAENLTPARLAKLLAERGDLPSSAILVADLDDIIKAIEEDIAEIDGQAITASLLVYTWAYKLKDRPDYNKFLKKVLLGYKVYDLVLMALWHNTGCPTDLSDITPDVFADVMINSLTGKKALRRCLRKEKFPHFNSNMVREARSKIAARRNAQAKTPPLEDKLDF